MQGRYEAFTALITDISRYIQKLKNSEMSEFGLKGNQVQCLYNLYRFDGGVVFGELCRLCGEDKAAVSRAVGDLESKGLVVGAAGGERKYKLPITLTDEGRKVGAAVSDKIDAVLDAGSAGITDDDRARLYCTLAVIAQNLKTVCEKKEIL